MPHLNVDTDHVFKASSQIATGATALQEQIQHFSAVITNLLDSGWRAPSADAFGAAHQHWNAAAQQMHIAIQQLGQAAGTAGNNFVDADQSSTVKG